MATPLCKMCKIFDHNDDHCPKKIKVVEPTQALDDGFMEVTRTWDRETIRIALDMKPLKCSEVYDGKAKRWTKIPNMWPGGGGNSLAPPLLAVPHRDKDSKAPPLLAILRNEVYVVDAITYTSFPAIGTSG
ncbi:hypothetical protein Tco_1553905 [Tanacetum coccineum]